MLHYLPSPPLQIKSNMPAKEEEFRCCQAISWEFSFWEIEALHRDVNLERMRIKFKERCLTDR